MNEKKFDPKKLAKLNNPSRLRDIPISFLGELLKDDRPDVIVDLGAGTGFFSKALVQHLQPSKLYACDISPVMLDWMREHVISEYPSIEPVLCSETDMPLDEGIADLVVMINLHHELSDPVRTLKESMRVLRDGGRILVIDWKKQKMEQGPPEHIRCSVGQVEQHFLEVGFKSVQVFENLEKHFVILAEA